MIYSLNMDIIDVIPLRPDPYVSLNINYYTHIRTVIFSFSSKLGVSTVLSYFIEPSTASLICIANNATKMMFVLDSYCVYFRILITVSDVLSSSSPLIKV